MVQHDSRVRRYSSQSTGMENTVGRRNTGSQYIGRNVYLSDFEQQEYQGNGQQTDEYYQETAYNQDMAYTQSAFSDQQYLSDYNETTEHRDTYYEPDYSDAVSSEDKILLD